jgi:hypothetical protein
MIVVFVIMLIVMILMTFLFVYFYNENSNLNRQSTLDRLSKMSETAEDIYWYRLWSYAGFYGTYMQNAGWYSNESNVVEAGASLLIYYSQVIVNDVESDLRALEALDEASRATYENVSNTLDYALAQIRDAVDGHGSNESLSLLWGLYSIFGVDQWSRSENLTGLRGLDWAFMELSSYWSDEYSLNYGSSHTMPPDQPNLNVILGWISGNSTALYQTLTEWHSHLS